MAHEDRRRDGGGNLRGLPRRVDPVAAGDAWGGQPEWREPGRIDYPAGKRARRRKRGKHGSDRIRGRGTRRFIE